MSKETNDTIPEEEYSDLIDLEITEHATIRAQSDLLRADISTYQHPELKCGVSVVQDGSNISLSAGTLDQSQTPHLYAWCGLTPDQARTMAAALTEAADKAETAEKRPDEATEDTQSFLQRLMGSG